MLETSRIKTQTKPRCKSLFSCLSCTAHNNQYGPLLFPLCDETKEKSALRVFDISFSDVWNKTKKGTKTQGLSCVCESVMSHSWILYFFCYRRHSWQSFLYFPFFFPCLQGGGGGWRVKQETWSAAATAVLWNPPKLKHNLSPSLPPNGTRPQSLALMDVVSSFSSRKRKKERKCLCVSASEARHLCSLLCTYLNSSPSSSRKTLFYCFFFKNDLLLLTSDWSKENRQ